MSKKINVNQLCQDLEALVGKAPYPDSGSGSTSYNDILKGAAVDCSGLLVAVFKKQGGSIYHGSNTIWRSYLSDKGSVKNHTSSNGYPKNVNPLSSSQLEKGMAVFKWNSETPSKFDDGLGDYQHIGIVTSVKPLRIVHSTSVNHQGVVCDTKIGQFCAWGYLKDVDYGSTKITDDEEDIEMNGGVLKTVSNMRIRASATVTSKVLATVPANTKLNFDGDFDEGWVEVEYKGTSGYMCTTSERYCKLISQNDDEDAEPTADGTLAERLAALEKKVDQLARIVNELT